VKDNKKIIIETGIRPCLIYIVPSDETCKRCTVRIKMHIRYETC